MKLHYYLLSVLLLPLPSLTDWESRGVVSLGQREYVSERNAFPSEQILLSLEPDWFTQLSPNWSFNFKPYARYDSLNYSRNALDFRELNFSYQHDNVDVKIGFSEVFWGVTESQHLVDIVNQTDVLSSIDGEDKLGQPMLQVNWLLDNGAIQAFVLPVFRNRQFAGSPSRLQPDRTILDDEIYQSGQGDNHIDYALRVTQSLGDWETGISIFTGTDRTPDFYAKGPDLQAYYGQTIQYGLELQRVLGAWLFKNETVYREKHHRWAIAHTTGFEYTDGGAIGDIDLGYLFEYSFDGFGEQSQGSFQKDLFLGIRVAINDVSGTEMLFGVMHDLDTQHWSMFRVEGSTRLNASLRVRGEVWISDEQRINDPVFMLKRDDFAQLSIEYYF